MIHPTEEGLQRLQRDVRETASQEHIPDAILRAYLSQSEIEEEIEAHLADCDQCWEAADRILAETASWQQEPGHLERLSARVRARTVDAEKTLIERLCAALQQLQATRPELRSRFSSWRERLEAGRDSALAVLRAQVLGKESGDQQVPGRLEGISALSFTSARFAYSNTTLRRAGSEVAEPDHSTITVTSRLASSVRIRVEGDEVEIRILDWEEVSPPLIVLATEEPEGGVLLAEGVVARFEGVKPGEYLLGIELAHEEHG